MNNSLTLIVDVVNVDYLIDYHDEMMNIDNDVYIVHFFDNMDNIDNYHPYLITKKNLNIVYARDRKHDE